MITAPTKILYYNFHTFRWLLFEGCVQGVSVILLIAFSRLPTACETNWNSISVPRHSLPQVERHLWRFHLLLSNIAQWKDKFVEELPSLNVIHALSRRSRTNLLCNRVLIKSPMSDKFTEFQLHTRRKKRIEYSLSGIFLESNFLAITLFSLISKSNLRCSGILYFLPIMLNGYSNHDFLFSLLSWRLSVVVIFILTSVGRLRIIFIY